MNNNEIEKIGNLERQYGSLNLEQKIDFLATTFGRDVIAAVEYVDAGCKSWYENGGRTIADLIAKDSRYEEYINMLETEACVDIDDDKEFWDCISGELSGLFIDGLPEFMLTEEELEEEYC